MSSRVLMSLPFGLVLCVACASPALRDTGLDAAAAPGPKEAPRVTEESGAPVIVVLQLRDERMVVHRGEDGPRFTVRAHGRAVSTALTDVELRERHTELWKLYQFGFAAQPEGPYLDARLDPPTPSPGLTSDR